MVKDYTGKIVKICYQKDVTYERSGIVLEQKESGERIEFRLATFSGQEQTITVTEGNIEKISPVRISSDLRTALQAYYIVWTERKALNQRYWKEQARLDGENHKAITAIQNASGKLDFTRFVEAVSDLLQSHGYSGERYGNSRGRIWCSSVGKDDFTISHEKVISKYVQPGSYSFIDVEYDQTLRIEEQDPSYRKFCEANAPSVIPEFMPHASISVSAEIGDKNTLSVNREYTFKLKHGTSKQSLEELEHRIWSK